MADEPAIHVENELALCEACEAQKHSGHVSHWEAPDGTTVVCPCKGECDGSLIWPPPEPQWA